MNTSGIDWSTVGSAIGAVVMAIGGYFTGRGRRQVNDAANDADASALNAAAS